MPIDVTWYSDPACPWAYSESPALAVLRWRYGAQLRWRLVTIGLSESTEYAARLGSTPARSALRRQRYGRYGMPFAAQPRSRLISSGRACRAIVATRLLAPGLEMAAHRALQLAWFNSTLLLDEDDEIARALAPVDGLDAAAVVAVLDREDVVAAYTADREAARSAAGGAAEMQGKAANRDGRVRFTAPSLVFECGGRRLEAGGFQPVEAYDVCIANLDPRLERKPPAAEPLAALRCFPEGLVTQEVAAIMAHENEAPDRDAAEAGLVELTAEGAVARVAVGDDALWRAVAVPQAASTAAGAVSVA